MTYWARSLTFWTRVVSIEVDSHLQLINDLRHHLFMLHRSSKSHIATNILYSNNYNAGIKRNANNPKTSDLWWIQYCQPHVTKTFRCRYIQYGPLSSEETSIRNVNFKDVLRVLTDIRLGHLLAPHQTHNATSFRYIHGIRRDVKFTLHLWWWMCAPSNLPKFATFCKITTE